MARIFWIIGLSAGVLLFSGFAVLGIILAIKDRNPRWLASALCFVYAYSAWQPLRVRIWGSAGEVKPLDIDF
jgi:hypothetical protein